MAKIFKNVLPYWKTVLIIVALLVLQAYCDLSLPQYTSDIIDIGIQNGGVEHVLPESITMDEFETAKVFMTDDEISTWEGSYELTGDLYQLKDLGNKKLNELDQTFEMPLVMNNQMALVREDNFKQMMATQKGMDASALEAIPLEMLGKQMGIELTIITRQEDDGNGNQVQVNYIDLRKMYNAMLSKGMMQKSDILAIRDKMQESFDTMGTSIVKSMAIKYAIAKDAEAGINMDHTQTAYLWMAGLKMLAMALLMAVTSVMVGFFAAQVGAGIGRDLRSGVYKKVMAFSNAEFDRFSTASLITRTTNDVQQIQMVLVLMLRMIAYAPILGIGGIIKVYNTKAGMGWVIGLAVLVIIGLVSLLMAIAMPKFKLMQKLVDALNLVSREILTGLSVIRAFGREKKEEERFDKANKDLTGTQLFTNRVMSFMMPSMMMIMYGLTVLIVWVAAHRIDSGRMQVGAMTAFITYAMQIVMSFLMLTMMAIFVPRAAVAAERIDEVLRTKETIKDPEQPETMDTYHGVVQFSHVNFKYPGAEANVLEDINFVAEPGKTTAIIGSTGCGKSTLINLIPRLYDVSEGSVTIDGHDVRNISMHDLRQGIGYVPQKGMLFSGTIASNLRYGKEDATDDEIIEAASIAQATEFIDDKAAKYDSPIAQGGANVSGGQKQRLSIARAIAKNPSIYIFDDSFSALDLKTDAALRKALAHQVNDKTVIIVAQRISTVLHADQILVMDDGNIVGKGTHEELLRNCEVYQQIAKSQLSAKELGLEVSGKGDEFHGRTTATV
jgi:ATP-binding cassette subfamily B protein